MPDYNGTYSRQVENGHADLVRNIAAALDIPAGLRDATLPSGHANLIGVLGQTLDIDAGVAAILSAPADLRGRRSRRAAATTHDEHNHRPGS